MDFNDDGMFDLVIGCRHGWIHYFRRTGSGNDDLTSEGKIRANGSVIDIGVNSAPVVVDWNNDGLLDLLIGDGMYNATRKTRIYLNSGTTSSYVFTNYTFLQNSGSDMLIQTCMPTVHDLNGDGKKDFISGVEQGYVLYYENVGTDANPVFNGFVRLKSNGNHIKVRRASRVAVTDWNNDGIPDLIVSGHDGAAGASQGYITLYLARSTDVSESHSEESSEMFRVEPVCNPVTDNFSIRLCAPAGPVSIEIYDSMGRMVKSSTVDGQSDTAVISAESMAIGVYTIVASDANNVSRCRMVLAN